MVTAKDVIPEVLAPPESVKGGVGKIMEHTGAGASRPALRPRAGATIANMGAGAGRDRPPCSRER
ncbi:MAG: hypothetical protein ACLTSG_14425 [Lachnospiraceae bacterium]